MKGVRRGCVRLKGAVIGIDDQDVNTFTITVDHKTFHFQARDSDEREKWVRRLEDTILRHANRGRGIWDACSSNSASNYYSMQSGGGGSSSAGGSGTGNGGAGSLHTPAGSMRRPDYLKTLDGRVSEADVYLQLMIEQASKIDAKLALISDEEELAKVKHIQDNANAMLENIKHSIVLLQIAKNTAHPINGSYQGPVKTESSEDDTAITPLGIPLTTTGIELGSECLENKLARENSVTPSSTAALSLFVPETSYSSSEGEEDFYDANDDPFTSQGNSPSSTNIRPFADPQSTASSPVGSTVGKSRQDSIVESGSLKKDDSHETSLSNATSPRVPVKSDGSLDYDALYEDEDESDFTMESHGNVVTHLLSQVKIGMDLTKVVLPTFILERRSLLEMYADYFAHPDLFLRVAELTDARDRMVQVVRWYMSAYHAGRKSTVAKKPYNPILGEVFQCHWDVPGDTGEEEAVSDGPVPWCRRNQLTFIAEQVSHHPPISAFYAEHYNKKISFAAHVWTKSKFLGLSIGVHNIGQGVVTLCDLNEEYHVTFPNGYGRSILTVPWIELGGSVQIHSPQTGYRAEIEFLTKPFYGGKRNKISAEIYAPNDKRSFMTIAGEWSGLMEAKYNDNNGKSKPAEVFVDVNQIPIHKKIVRPIAEQTGMESRRIWKEVTAGLRLNDIERATNAKCNVEQKQRDEARIRKETNAEWSQQYFRPVGDAWIYTNPLSQRVRVKQHDTDTSER